MTRNLNKTTATLKERQAWVLISTFPYLCGGVLWSIGDGTLADILTCNYVVRDFLKLLLLPWYEVLNSIICLTSEQILISKKYLMSKQDAK